MSDVQTLLDKAALQDLQLRYFRATDRRDPALLRSLYHDDAIEDRGGTFRGTIDEFVAWMPKVTAQFELTVHRVFNMLFEIEGDYAESETYAEAYHRTFPPDAKEIIAGGRYLDRYARRNGVWKFTYRTSTIDRCQIRPADAEAYKSFVAASAPGLPGSDDPSYKVLRLFGRMGA